jgi:ATP-dependent protease ClpP protease subunit
VVSLRGRNGARVRMWKPRAGTWEPSNDVIDLDCQALRPMIAMREGEKIKAMAGSVEVKSAGAATELYLYGDIGPGGGIDAPKVQTALKGRNDAGPLNIYLSSPGGSPFEGIAITSILGRWRGRTVTYVDGIAASAATLIAAKTDSCVIAQEASYMIHRASTLAVGNRDQMQHTVALLEQVDAQMARLYNAKTGISVEKLLEKMSEEWWMSGPDAVKHGFADAIAAPSRKNSQDARAYHDRPWFARTTLGPSKSETGNENSTRDGPNGSGPQSSSPTSAHTGAVEPVPPVVSPEALPQVTPGSTEVVSP